MTGLRTLGPQLAGRRPPSSRAAFTALAWNYSCAIAATVLQLCYTACTARLVLPHDYGTYATSSTALTLFGYFAGAGLATYLLRAERLTRQALRTAWTVSGVSGTLCCVAVQVAAPLCTAVWRMPEAGSMLRLAGLQFLVQPAAAVAIAALRRLGHSRSSALIELLAQVVGMAGGTLLLAVGWNPYGLAAAPVLTAVCILTVSGLRLVASTFEAGPPVPARSLIGLSSAFAGYGLLQSLTNSTPMWAVARVMGPAAAGQFSRASLAVGLPVTLFCQSLHRAVVPPLARINGDGRPLRSAVHDLLSAASALAFVSFGAMAGVGPVALRLLLGPGWDEAGKLVPVLAVGGACSVLYAIGYAVDEVRKVIRRLLWLQLTVGAATLIAVAASAAAGGLLLIAIAATATTGFGHVLQLLRWHQEQLCRLPSLARIYLVHAAVGAALYAGGRAGASLAAAPGIALGSGLLGMAPVALICVALRRRMPLYATAAARGLVS
ncbi:oligosaccharide flippase family protein [Streptomyces sp. NPDC002671]